MQRRRHRHLLARRDVQELVRAHAHSSAGRAHPVITNCVLGNLSPSMPMNGIDAAFAHVGRPAGRTPSCEASVTAFSSHGASGGACQPLWPPSPASNSTRGAVRRIGLQRLLHRLHGFLGVERRRRAHADLGFGVGQQHVAGVDRLGIARHADRRELRPPGAVQHHLAEIARPSAWSCRRRGTCDRPPGPARARLPRPARCAAAGSARRAPAASCRRVASSSSRVSRPRMMRNEEGTIPDASPECTPSFSTRTFSVPARDAAQRRREPQPVPVAAARIEADDQRRIRRCARAGGRHRRAGRSCRILAALDHDDAAGARHLLLLQRQQARAKQA